MKVIINKLRRSETSDHHAVNVLKEGTAYGETALKGYVSSIRSLMDKNKESPKVIIMKDGMSKQYWEKFGLFFEAQPAPPPAADEVTQLNLYEIFIGDHKAVSKTSACVLILASSIAEAQCQLIKHYSAFSDKKLMINEIKGPFTDGTILCAVDSWIGGVTSK